MKKSPVHYGGAMRTPCGLHSVDLMETSNNWGKVTCKRCLRAKKFHSWANHWYDIETRNVGLIEVEFLDTK